MQRKFLEDLGLEKEIVDKIMSENGSDIEKTKARLEAERDNYKEQLETAQNALKEFDGIDVKELQGKIETLNNDLKNKETEYQSKIADMEFSAVLDSAISSSKARNSKAVKALLDIEALRNSKNQSEDIKTAIEAIKADNDYLFESNEPINNPVAPTGTGNPSSVSTEAFAKMGYMQRLALKKSDPEKYNQLKG